MPNKKSGHEFRKEKKKKLELQSEVIKKTAKIDNFFKKENEKSEQVQNEGTSKDFDTGLGT